MKNSNLVKSFCGMLSVGLLCLMASCSSSPEKQLNGAWDCKYKGESHGMNMAVADGVITMSDPADPQESMKLKIEKVDGDVIHISKADKSNDSGSIRLKNKDTIILVDEDGKDGPVCTRK